jgi:predicted permease
MALVRRVIGGLRGLFQRARVDQELDVELQHFIDEAIDEKMRIGMDREAATRAARLEVGSTEALKDRVRDVGWESAAESLWLDARFAARSLRKSPGFAAVTILTLALAIGATTAIFSLLDAVLMRSLPVRNPGELVLVSGPLYPVFQAYQRHTDIFTDVCATSGVRALDVEIQNGSRESTSVSLVSGTYFTTLGVHAAIGRTFTGDEDRAPGRYPVAVASYGYWQRRFGREAAILNQEVRISGTPITIIGVAAPGFFGEEVGVAPDLWVPLTMWGHVVPGRNLLESPGTGWLRIIGRLRPGVIASAAQAELTGTFRHVLTEIHGPNPAADVRRDLARVSVTFEPTGKGLSNLRTRWARPLQLLMGAVALVLLIACANIANLLLTRAAARRREIELRLALGMSRARLVRQLLTESLLLAALGGASGVAVAWLGREALLRLISADGSRLPVVVATDARLLVFVAVVSLMTAIVFGLAPAWRSARSSMATSLAVRREAGGQQPRLRSLLVIMQVAVSLVLLMGAGLFLRTIANLRDVDLGFDPQQLVVAAIDPQAAGYRGDRALALTRELLDAIASVPGVASASMSEHGVLLGTDNGTNLMHPEGLVAGPEGFPQSRWDVVGPRYFSTIGTRLLSGRDFTERDNASSPLVVAINEEMARQFFGGANAIGRRLVWGVGIQKGFEVIAVTRDVKYSGPRDEVRLRFYLPYLQLPAARPNWQLGSTRFLARTAADPTALAPRIREAILATDPKLSAASLNVGAELVGRTLVRERMVAILLVAFGLLAAGLACLGLYGLIAHQVVQCTSEIGIRMALGAQRGDVLRVMLRRPLVWIASGIAIGIPLSLSASGVAQSLLFGLTAMDTATLVAAVVVMSGLGLLGAYIPARRALRVDPIVALRAE